LFRAASRARSAGRHQEAAALYGVLQRDYAGSETEVVARVALGRLWLGHLNDPAAALEAFESYLRARTDGPLSEEARSGRVLALRRLGRLDEAERAREDLLRHHPTTLYAKTVTGTP
jgi:tetratricopeptide (TPR) repeat protein